MLDKDTICVGCKANLAPSQRDLDHTTSRDLAPQPLGKRTRKIALFVQVVRESALEAHPHGLMLDKYNTHIDCKANIAPSQRDLLRTFAGVVKTKTRKIAVFVQVMREIALEAHPHGIMSDERTICVFCKANLAPSQRDLDQPTSRDFAPRRTATGKKNTASNLALFAQLVVLHVDRSRSSSPWPHVRQT